MAPSALSPKNFTPTLVLRFCTTSDTAPPPYGVKPKYRDIEAGYMGTVWML